MFFRKVLQFTFCFLLLIPQLSIAQCTVDINPHGPLTLCNGDSVVLTAHVSSGGQTILDQSATIYNGGTSARNLPGYSYFQTFTTGISGILTQLDIGFFNFINGTGYLVIYDGAGISGNILDSMVVQVHCAGGSCLVPFQLNIPVQAGSTYTFRFIGGAGIPDPYGLQVDVGGSYPGGQIGFVDPSGTYYPGYDMVFNTYVMDSIIYQWSTGSTDTSITVHSSGLYYVSISSYSGCSAMDSVQLNFVNIDTSVSQNGITLSANEYGASYQWMNCEGNILLTGDTSQSFSPVNNGSYAVIISKNGCTDTSSCHTIMTVNNQTESNSGQIRIFPNPTSGLIHFYTGGDCISIEVYDILGKKVISITGDNREHISINLSGLNEGTYIIKMIGNSYRDIQKIILQ